jgi:prepilin-type N-terminal cleavage/methylation domain-containing protein
MKNNKKGFTLTELLIVVAIIGILVAVAIPIFNQQLKKARFATNQANARSAYACARALQLTETDIKGAYYDMNNDHNCTAAWGESHFDPGSGVHDVIQGDVNVYGLPDTWTLEDHPELGQRVYDANIAVDFTAEDEHGGVGFYFKHSSREF